MQVRSKLSIDRLRSMLVNAFEGGSNYWYMIEEPKILAPEYVMADFKKGGKCQPDGDYYHWSQLIPTTKGCALLVSAPGEFKPVVLNLEALKIGAQVMAEKYPKQFAEIMAEEDDSETGDILLQCALYGEVIFG